MSDEIRGVNLQRVIEHKEINSLIKYVAMTIKESGYYSLSLFLRTISNSDLQSLVEDLEMVKHVNDLPTGEFTVLENLIILSEMLSQAEGCIGNSDDEAEANFNYFSVVLVCESLKRKGIVTINYDNISFCDEMRDKVFVTKI